ncbi:DNA repair and recombination protein RAD54B-like isoform X2 [Sipha flava]|uniref:DNA repair and recombination protein RAD54-like n=1 Tax=Sipha flava TaxID=143950 RepID=A0A8B8FTS1_9HEMI|nr:DNA repair and recombination protein RAD54B-like isoform X2 [Sipha flava]
MRRSRAPSQQFPLVPKEDLEKGVKVVRSQSDILALIKSCDNTTTIATDVSETFEPPSCAKESPVVPPLQVPQNVPKIKLKPIGPRILKSNLPVSAQIPEVECKKEIKETVVQSSNSLNSKKYNVTWGKQTKKKHKTWEGDGYLTVHEKLATLYDLEGHKLGCTTDLKPLDLEDGSIIVVGSKQVQILDLVIESDIAQSEKLSVVSRPLPPRKRPKISVDMSSPEALFMPEPDIDHQSFFNKKHQEITPVVLESFLAKHLRPHQKTGITFLYECVSGFKSEDYFGAILADEMGLGKTFQTICLVWMLLKRGPYGGIPLAKRVLIITPSSLVGNWENEFTRWLGKDRLRLFAVDQKNKPSEFARLPTRNYPVMITSYEMLVRCIEEIENINFDLMICDEGHRLKNNNTNTSIALNQVKCKRRVLLTGTPIQNELAEFFSLIDFVNPGILGTYAMFKREFEDIIVESQQPDCHPQIIAQGKKKATELNEVTEKFILRRTQNVNNKYLPSKNEYIVFCAMTPVQISLYEETVSYWENRVQEFGLSIISHFGVITTLKKICNHPDLVLNKKNISDSTEETLTQHLNRTAVSKHLFIESSGKLIVVENLLKELHKNSSEKTVLISYYTQTLDVFVKLCNIKNYKYLRLDGTTATALRTDIVKKFNTSQSEYSVLLLSAKAGGVGLNLVGASNLILYDSDWNPASDQQAMARIWRDGQKKSVHIYRLLTSGTIEEKIFQRQISKTGLSEAITNPDNQNNTKLSFDQLKDLFNFKRDALCLTHDLLECDCGGNGLVLNNNSNHECNDEKSEAPLRVNELMKWEHYSSPFKKDLLDVYTKMYHSVVNTYEFRW